MGACSEGVRTHRQAKPLRHRERWSIGPAARNPVAAHGFRGCRNRCRPRGPKRGSPLTRPELRPSAPSGVRDTAAGLLECSNLRAVSGCVRQPSVGAIQPRRRPRRARRAGPHIVRRLTTWLAKQAPPTNRIRGLGLPLRRRPWSAAYFATVSLRRLWVGDAGAAALLRPRSARGRVGRGPPLRSSGPAWDRNARRIRR